MLMASPSKPASRARADQTALVVATIIVHTFAPCAGPDPREILLLHTRVSTW